jgi:DNA-binding NtrC family response regulator
MQSVSEPAVLLVDDERLIVDGFKRSLQREPYEIITAVSPFDALRLLEARPVDVVVSDQRMSGMEGSELLSHVRKRWPHVVRILVTGESDLETTTRAIRDGELYRLLCKPVSADDLRRTLRMALNLRNILGGLR